MELAILKQLQSLTDVEKKQKEHHVFSDDIPPTAIDLRESKTANVPVLNDFSAITPFMSANIIDMPLILCTPISSLR